ncbi:hypothetical protein PV772_14095 [Pseudarthrobacter sp. CC12]|uniref:hypothetical protein n=1 Tax=Pseudarthrobacter sp. CC12 TaxID=3029193 RepID=UPI0032648939
MTASNRSDEYMGAGSAAAPSPTRRRRALPGGVLGWARKRVVSAIAVAAASAVFLLAATGIAAVPTSGWTGYVFVAAGSILAGLLAGSYVGAPIGAAATFCDLRWPVAGLLGLVWANTYRGDQPPAQIAVGILALAVMAWALRARLELERRVSLAPDPGNAEAEVCTDCRPLFPAKPQQPS